MILFWPRSWNQSLSLSFSLSKKKKKKKITPALPKKEKEKKKLKPLLFFFLVRIGERKFPSLIFLCIRCHWIWFSSRALICQFISSFKYVWDFWYIFPDYALEFRWSSFVSLVLISDVSSLLICGRWDGQWTSSIWSTPFSTPHVSPY